MLHLQRYACVVFLLTSVVFGQESRSTITGRVSDPQDAGVAGVKVTISNIDTGVAVLLTTNDKGVFTAPLLSPGDYRVDAEHPGFKKAGMSRVNLSVNETQQVDLRLEL